MSSSRCNLPTDLVMDVLSRLRAKFIVRCRSVSKLWLKLLTDPYFIKLHSARSLTNPFTGLIFCVYPLQTLDCGIFDDENVTPESIIDSATYFIFNKDDVIESQLFLIVGSCKGLVCIKCYFTNSLPDVLFLLNPSTGEYVKFPFDMTVHLGDDDEFLHLGDDYEFLEGFGYDPVSQQYKIVRIVYLQQFDHSIIRQVTVFTIGDTCTRVDVDKSVFPSPLDFYGALYKQMYRQVHVNGVLHYLNDYFSAKSILTFDLGAYKFGVLPLPGVVYEKHFDRFIYLQEVQGCLSIVRIYEYSHVDIWLMKSYGIKESWAILFSVTQPIEVGNLFTPLLTRKNGQIVLDIGSAKMLVYSQVDTTSRTVNLLPILLFPFPTPYISYVETLTSVASIIPGSKMSILKKDQTRYFSYLAFEAQKAKLKMSW